MAPAALPNVSYYAERGKGAMGYAHPPSPEAATSEEDAMRTMRATNAQHRTLPRVLLISAVAASLLAGPIGTAEPVEAAPPTYSRRGVGAAGLGDPYFPYYGNGGYDVAHYALRLHYEPDSDRLEGVATIRAAATQNLRQFNLDFVGLTVRSVTVNGAPAWWHHGAHELVIQPSSGLRVGSPFEVVVAYDGVPVEFQVPDIPGLRMGWMATDDGVIVNGVPEVAASWFPANDHPSDKASYTFEVTVPSGLGVVANGSLVSQTTSGDSATFVWDAPDPMAPYLATVNIGEWDVRTWTTAGGIPVYDAVDPDLGTSADGPLARQGVILDVLAAILTPYPFSTVGAIVDDEPDLVFALETQTRPIYPRYVAQFGDHLVVHELAHQWFGNHVGLSLDPGVRRRDGVDRGLHRLAEEVSGRDLSPLFDAWLYTPAKPALGLSASATDAAAPIDDQEIRRPPDRPSR